MQMRPRRMSLPCRVRELVDHIVLTCHDAFRRAYLEFEDDNRSHLTSEEEGLFPQIRAGRTDDADIAALIEELEREMHRHVNTENNALFPRFQKAAV